MATKERATSLAHYFRIVILLLVKLTNCERVDFTCYNPNPVLSDSTTTAYIAGYKGSSDLTNSLVTFERTIDTSPDSSLPILCSCSSESVDSSAYPIVRQTMNCPGGPCTCQGTKTSGCLYRLGAFNCVVTSGSASTTITTITMGTSSAIIPFRQTITANLNERVSLNVTIATGTDIRTLRWKKSARYYWLVDWAGKLLGTIDQVQMSDSGVYECHQNGDRRQAHAVLRLIIRGCAYDLWGPNCNQLCPVCFNGGMCHHTTGECICPPGFSGQYCQNVCGRNCFGLSSTLRCDTTQDRHGTACRGALFCLEDPFGCTCASGYQGIDCNSACPSDTFGPYCSQTCHCGNDINCLQDTGECYDSLCTNDGCTVYCAQGWKGSNCQVMTPCQVGRYGVLCNDVCYCLNSEACEEETGVCSNGCPANYVGPTCSEYRQLQIIAFEQVFNPNPGQPLSVRCVVSGNPLPESQEILLSSAQGQFTILQSSTSSDLNSYTRTNVFQLDGATAGSTVTCYLSGMSLEEHVNVDINVLPYLTTAPRLSRISDNPPRVEVTWDAHSSFAGHGDGPVEEYNVRYHEQGNDASLVVLRLSSMTTSVVVGSLSIDTEYVFTVAVVRPGVGGTGPPSPQNTITTRCLSPTAPLTTITLSARSSTQLWLSWELPDPSTWRCKSVDRVYVSIRRGSTGEFRLHSVSYNSDLSQVTLYGLASCTTYGVTAVYSNRNANSSTSTIAQASTTWDVPNQVTDVNVYLTTDASQLSLTWVRPEDNGCAASGYIITNTLLGVLACTETSSVVVQTETFGSDITSTTLNGICPYSSYSISVVASNSAGNSAAAVIQRTTAKSLPSFVPMVTAPVVYITDTSIRFTWDAVPCESLNGQFVSYDTDETNLDTAIRNTMRITGRDVVLSSLPACTTYRLRVAVRNDIGLGTYSEPALAATVMTSPLPVRNLMASAVEGMSTSLSIQWSAPSGLCPVDRYIVSYRLVQPYLCWTNEGLPVNISGTTSVTSHDIVGLLPYSRYFVYVVAMNSVGESRSKSVAQRTAEAAPIESPTNVVSVPSIVSVMFLWELPPCRGRLGQIDSYSYQLTDIERDSENRIDEATQRQVTIEGLTPYMLYSFQVRAHTAAGHGPYSEGHSVRTLEARPLQVTGVTTPSADASSITVQWLRPDPPYGQIIAYHVVYTQMFENQKGQQMSLIVTENLDERSPRVVLEDLYVNSNYSIQVQAETNPGKGPLSETMYRTTQEGRPGPPSSLAVVNKTQTTLSVAWEEPLNPNGEIVNYMVRYRVKYKPYDRGYTPGEFLASPELNPTTRARTVTGLKPSTKYEVSVSASTQVGEGSLATIEEYTKPVLNLPVPTRPELNPAKSSGTFVAISITPVQNDYVTSYLVAVRRMSKRTGRQLTLTIQGEEFGSFATNPDSYLAAEMNKSELMGDFVVGDNRTYGSFYNPPLVEGDNYEIRIGAASRTNDSHTFNWSKPLAVQAGGYATDEPVTEGSGSSSAGVIATVISIILIVCLAGFVVVLVMRRRRADSAKPFDSVGRAKENKGVLNAKNPIAMSELKQSSPSTPKRTSSEDCLSDQLANPPRGKAPSRSATLPVHTTTKPAVTAKPDIAPSSGPVALDCLSDYIKRKKAKNNDGFKKDYASLPDGQVHSWDVAKAEENKTKNRYANIIAYDYSRVLLDKLVGQPHSDYINATYIDGYEFPNKYIASQGPNITSTNDMWRMVWQERTGIIVMVTHLIEGGKKKCAEYWPSSSMYYGDIMVKLDEELVLADYTIRKFTITKDDKVRKLKQFHFMSWPDMGLPQFATPLLNFVRLIKKETTPKMGPTIVHCSAGVGRTGTFITIDAMLDQAKVEGSVDVLKFVSNMRDKRIKMVQTQDQYIFIFDALLEAYICGETGIAVDDLSSECARLKTPSANGYQSMMAEEYSKLSLLRPLSKSDRYRGGKDPSNRDKNRFLDRLPSDRHRPYLMTMGTESSTNYINASFINGYWKRDEFIATQSPLPSTIIDFWSLIYDYKSPVIVMLNELDPSDETLEQYWPNKSVSAYGPLTVQLTYEETVDGVVCRTFTVDNLNKLKEGSHTVTQFEFQGWQDELPPVPASLLMLINSIERCTDERTSGPMTVHCIDGVGSCGVFCTVLSMLHRLKAENIVDVFQAVKSVQNNRPGMISTLQQYNFCYKIAQTQLDSTRIYENC